MTRPTRDRRFVCIVSTVPAALTAFMAPHIRALSEDQAVMLVTSGGPEGLPGLLGPRVTFQSVDIARNASIVGDLRALFTLWRLFRTHRFDVVQSITPKAGLLAMVAGWLAGVPNRIHWFVGQVWATKRGASRWFLKTLDRVVVKAATRLLADSPSQRMFLEAEGVARAGEITVLGDGSVCGVDTTRFSPDPQARYHIREQLGIPAEAVVALFVGRLNKDKGIPELTEAFAQVARVLPMLHLLLVGTDEGHFRPWIREITAEVQPRVHFVDYTYAVETYMAASDIFMLPSHREGFGATVIEAASCEVPAIATRIYGLTDAVSDGVSGVLVPVRDVSALGTALTYLSTHHEVRRRMGRLGRERITQHFSEARLTAALESFYDTLQRGAVHE